MHVCTYVCMSHMCLCGAESMHTFSPPGHVNGLVICQDDLSSKVQGNFTLLQETGEKERSTESSVMFCPTTKTTVRVILLVQVVWPARPSTVMHPKMNYYTHICTAMDVQRDVLIKCDTRDLISSTTTPLPLTGRTRSSMMNF